MINNYSFVQILPSNPWKMFSWRCPVKYFPAILNDLEFLEALPDCQASASAAAVMERIINSELYRLQLVNPQQTCVYIQFTDTSWYTNNYFRVNKICEVAAPNLKYLLPLVAAL